MKFIDIANIIIKSGDGGKGHVSFRKEKFVPKGGPDGGNGGKGGDVILKADPQMSTLLDFKYKRHYTAQDGKPGGKNRRSGKGGADITIRIPAGTVIKMLDSDEIIADLTKPGEEYIIAAGGIGGLGNSEFATPTNQTPRYAQEGRPGIEMEIQLELKSIADVGIVGFPNVGKSTLISVISSAKPKIADYPFTTLVPNLGIVKIGQGQNFTVADIPGLIEGASEGKGLGIQFLRHVERTRLLVFLLDSLSDSPSNDYKTLSSELEKYNPEMAKKDRIICFSKIDTIDDEQKKAFKKIKFGKKAVPIFMISSVTGESIDKLKWEMWHKLDNF
jgi:GTP-binding protein